MAELTSNRLRRPRPALALTLLAALLVGYAAHGWHHLSDPDCDTARGPGAHPCVACAALHGSVLLGDALPSAAPVTRVERDAYCAPAASATPSAPRSAASPRAPPAA